MKSKIIKWFIGIIAVLLSLFTQAIAAKLVALSPHLVENILMLGAQNQLVGIDQYSQQRFLLNLPSVGNAFSLDIEKIISLNPDLVLYWQSSNAQQIGLLKQLGIKLLASNVKTFKQITQELNQLAILTNTQHKASLLIGQFNQALDKLTKQYQHATPLRVFYQTWHKPLLTIGNNQVITKTIKLCGAVNIFSNLANESVNISIESVIKKNPDVIIVTQKNNHINWHHLLPNSQVVYFEADSLSRMSINISAGIKSLCAVLDKQRQYVSH